jgi:hypothetical protein
MKDNNKGFFKCPHCEGTGVCTANEGLSCGTCLKVSKVKKESKIVRCDVCNGCGMTETKSDRLNNRAPFIVLTIVIITFYTYALFNLIGDNHFDQIFPLVGSLTTMIATFYFAKK